MYTVTNWNQQVQFINRIVHNPPMCQAAGVWCAPFERRILSGRMGAHTRRVTSDVLCQQLTFRTL